MTWRDRIRDGLRGQSAYHVASPSQTRVKLDANESPFPLSDAARATMAKAVADVDLHRYPDPNASALKAALATHFGCDAAELSLGNGSDETLGLLCNVFGAPGRVVIPSPSFVVYRTMALAAGLEPVMVPLGPRFAADGDALLSAVHREKPNLVFLATPNNPTGTVWPREIIAALAAESDTITVVDEAYLAYAQTPSCIDLVRRHANVVVVRTLSKIGLAALRVGALIAQPEVVATVEKIRPPYNIGALNQRVATQLLTHHGAEFAAHAATVIAERERLSAALAARAVDVFPSQANLILVRVADTRACWQKLAAAGIAVRTFGAGPLADCLRITVGAPAENDALLSAWDS